MPIGYFFDLRDTATSVASALTAVLLWESIPGVARTNAANMAHGLGIAPQRMWAKKFVKFVKLCHDCHVIASPDCLALFGIACCLVLQ